MDAPRQEALPLQLKDQGDFSTFVAGAAGPLIESLRAQARDHGCGFYLVCGPSGCGKSHLLSALSEENPGAFSIDLRLARSFSPEFLNIDLPYVALIDNADAASGDPAWELALFELYNRWYDGRHGCLVMSATPSFDQIPFLRRDLNTRLGSGITIALGALQEDDCVKALRLRARARGFELPQAAASFLTRRFGRDLRKLVAILDRLDSAQLEDPHSLTVPFVKKILGLD